MELTTGAILRRITRTDLSVSAHKLATLILDAIAWKDGYNGLPRGTAAFTLSDLARQMGVSRQYLHVLLSELATSGLQLMRQRLRGPIALWRFHFGCCDEREAGSSVSGSDDSTLYKEDSNKNVFSGMIVLDRSDDLQADRWLPVIRTEKAQLPCRGIDSQHIWERFSAFNRRRGHNAVPAVYLLGFMRKWRGSGGIGQSKPASKSPPEMPAKQRELQELVALAPVANRQFHEDELIRTIGLAAYEERVRKVARSYGCPRFTAALAVHGSAALAGEVQR